ncbi:MAG: hypothetical protein KC713_03090, partial [Candidatus Omnitrophica bacterium]|nr:hypothetical protein [Candidatus Omnitrophota bacterium]
MRNLLNILISVCVSLSMVISPVYAQVVSLQASLVMTLPAAGELISVTPAFQPAMMQGMSLYPDDPLKFDFMIHPGQVVLDDQAYEQESLKLIKYFLASLTTPEDHMWVNLSPYESDRIIANDFGNTTMGRDLLAQDYMLKQLSASLTHPDSPIGELFWERVYDKALEKLNITDIPVNTFNKIWIIPEY